jgi:hypothetical protein
MEKYNEGEWECKQSRMDPCLFTLKSPAKKRKREDGTWSEPMTGRIWFIVHTDDIDCIGDYMEDMMELADYCDKEWKIKLVDAEHMLGIQRRVHEEDGRRVVELTMTEYISDLYNTYKEFMPKKQANTPFPDKIFLHKMMHLDEGEGDRIKKRGFQAVVGSLLWASRNVFPEISCGINFLCRVMSNPSEIAWGAAMHMISYLYKEKDHGVRYVSDGNDVPIAHYDSSNKPDPSDGKCQYGFVIHLYGGPICWTSKKHAHVGLSSGMNEYMALCHCIKTVVWLRQLLEEMGLNEMTEKPTLVFGDNDNCTRLSKEDIVTSGNKFYYLPYHYSKEAVAMGHVKTLRCDTTENLSDPLTKNLTTGKCVSLFPSLKGYDGFLVEIGHAHYVFQV